MHFDTGIHARAMLVGCTTANVVYSTCTRTALSVSSVFPTLFSLVPVSLAFDVIV